MILIADYFIFLFLTKDSNLAIEATLGISLYATAAYFMHKRVWNRIKWRRQKTKSMW